MGNNLEYFRKKAKITRAELANMVNVDRTLIWRYEKGICQPRDEVKIRIAKALGKTVEEIFLARVLLGKPQTKKTIPPRQLTSNNEKIVAIHLNI